MEEIKMNKLYLIRFILLFFMSNIAYSQVSLEIEGYFGGKVYCGAVSGNYAYVGQGLNITVLDLSGTEPQQVASLEINRQTSDIFVSGDFAYIYAKDPDTGFLIVNISDPLNIALTGSCPLHGYQYGAVFVQGDHAYVAAEINGFYIIDISDPSQPFVTGEYLDGSSLYDVYVEGTIACLADKNANLTRLIDVTDPSDPYEIGNCAGLWPVSVCIKEDHAYVAEKYWEQEEQKGMRVIDISDPSNPVSVAYFETLINAEKFLPEQIGVAGDYAYLATQRSSGGERESWLFVVDISDPLDPFEAGKVETNGYPLSLQISAPKTYISNTFSALAFDIVDISDPSDPLLETSFITPGTISQMILKDDILFVSSYEGLFIYETSERGMPELLMAYPDWQAYGFMYLKEDVICATYFDKLFIIDITDIYNIQELSSNLTMDSFIKGLAGHGEYVYLPVENKVNVVNISDPTNPLIEDDVELMGEGRQIFIDGLTSLLYATYYIEDSDHGFQIFDISDPANIVSLSSMQTTADPECIFEYGNITYLGTNTETTWSLESFDVSDPSSPQPLEDTGGDGYITSITGNDTVVYAGVIGQSVLGFSPELAALIVILHTHGTLNLLIRSLRMYTMQGRLGDFKEDNGLYGVATINIKSQYTGIEDVNFGNKIISLEQNFPNPFSDQTELRYTIREKCNVSVNVYNINGQEINMLMNRHHEPGDYTLIFDATGLENGIYFFMIAVKSGSKIHKSYMKGLHVRH